MKTIILSSNLVRLLFIVVLVMPLAMGGLIPAMASYNGNDIVGWGYNGYGQTTIPSGLTDVVAISADYGQNLALKGDGTVIGWGYNYWGAISIPSDLTGVVAISAGEKHSLALKGDGTVVGWGNNESGQTTIPSGLTDVIAIDAGSRHSLALKSDGTVVGWGSNANGQTTIPSGLTDVIAIAAGLYHNLALKSDGTVVGWGYNYHGQATIPSDLTGVVAISAGLFHSLVLKGDGTVVGWGWNEFGQTDIPTGLTDVVAISAGYSHNLALKSDGTVIGWGQNANGQADIPPGLTGVVIIAAGGYHNLAIVETNTAPTANPGGPYLGAVNTSISFDGSLSSDPEGDTLTHAWTFGDGSTGTGSNPTHTYTASGSYNVCLTVNDGSLDSAQACTLADVSDLNTAPAANPGGPYLGAVNTAIQFDGSLSTDPDGDPLTYSWSFGNGSTDTGPMPTYTYTASGVFTVCLTVNDDLASSDPACTLAVVYDPSAGFVTGGGWIDSPAGAYKEDETLSGQATFGFVAKYKKGEPVPSGSTAFEFDLAGMAFASQSYEWLVVNQGGTNAQFKGSGLINGAPDPNGNAYKFMLWAGDNSPDTFRIRIWWEDAAGEHDVYDNGVNQVIGAGNIVVHTGK